MLDTLQMWSEKDKAVVEWKVILRKDADGTSCIEANYGDEYHRFSPNTTDEELENLAANIKTGVSAQTQDYINNPPPPLWDNSPPLSEASDV